MDFYGFYTGQNFDDYTWLGAHLDGNKCTFRTFAPSANNVQLLINGNIYQMNQIYNGNFYEITIDGVKDGDCYEYRIFSGNGNYVDHCDPYGYGMELRPNHKSIV
ncbi:MAG: glycogen-branching enzyme, partial [Lachnospiraceae bacterium]|nr:glycogen-branching enzyme [Lachnospiraceae bacterium]